MRTQNESDREKGGTDTEEPRKAAGFEVLAAERDEVIILFATKFYMLGISVLIMIISIICWIGTYWAYEFFVWSVFSMLSIGLIIFLPEYFSNIINVVIHFCYWVAFSIYVLVRIIQAAVYRAKLNEEIKKSNSSPAEREAATQLADRIFAYFIGCGCVILPLAILVTFLMFRFFFFFYKNR